MDTGGRSEPWHSGAVGPQGHGDAQIGTGTMGQNTLPDGSAGGNAEAV